MTMTEEQMRNRMKEIDEERDKLKFERKTYENYFSDKKMKEKVEDHKKLEGKCFLTKNYKDNKNEYVKAFKVLRVLDYPNENCAECLVLIDGRRKGCWNEYGVQTMVLFLWSQNEPRLMARESDPKMIDFYKEISETQFEYLYRKHMGNIHNLVI